MLRALQNQNWSTHGALSEFVDNSFGEIRGNATRVEIFHHPRRHILSVLDNGRGMDWVGSLFRLADTVGRSARDIGEYGSGGTMALLYLFKDVSVWTLRGGKVGHYHVNWPDIFEMSDWPQIPETWERATANNTPEPLYRLGHGTFIRGQLLHARKVSPSNVRRDLAANYAPAVREGREVIWRGEGQEPVILATPLPSFDDGKVVNIDFVLATPSGAHLGVRGQIGVISDLPGERSLVHVGFRHRVIFRTKDFYSAPDGSEHFRVAGIAGWLDLVDGWRELLVVTKDRIADEPAYQRLREEIFRRIRPLLVDLQMAKQSLVFDEIAFELSAALDSEIKTTIHIEPPEPRTPPTEPSGKEGGRGSDSKSAAPPESEEGPEREHLAAARLVIVQWDDLQMAQRLCFAEEQGGEIAVYINSEHPIMRRALDDPINRDFLATTVLREVASLLSDERALLERAFRPHLVRSIDRADEEVRVGLIHRMLLDRVRSEAA